MLGGTRQGVKRPFFSKKCIFWQENDVFSKKSFYSKLISDQNYIKCTCQKIHFQNKIMRLQFSPDSTYQWVFENKSDLFCISSDTFVGMVYSELTKFPEKLHVVLCHGHPPQLGPVQPWTVGTTIIQDYINRIVITRGVQKWSHKSLGSWTTLPIYLPYWPSSPNTRLQ